MKFDITKERIDEVDFIVARTLEPLTNEEYDELKPTIESMGGHWRERVKGFCFSQESLKKTNYSKWQESIQFFPTPIKVAMRLKELSGITSYEGTPILLEPSAGQGGLLAALDEDFKGEIITIEPNDTNSKILEEKGYSPLKITFEEYFNKMALKGDNVPKFTHVLMNPPFSLGRDISHVKMAYNLLTPGGVLTAIISENTLYYTNPSNQEFVTWLKSKDAYIEPVPYGSFIDCGTAIDTIIIRIYK